MDRTNDYNDTSGYDELFLAVHNGELNLVHSLLEKYSATETLRGRKLLHVAAARGHLEIVKLFITNRDGRGNTPLHLAIRENQPEVFNLLLEESNLNAKNSFHQNPLHYAAIYNRPEFAKALIDNGAIINVKDHCRKTPLDVALSEENVQMAEILFKHGAVLSDSHLTYMRPLRDAVRKENFEMIKLLMANGCNKVDIPNDDGIFSKSSLNLAISSRRLDILKFLIENGIKNSSTVNKDDLRLFNIITRIGGGCVNTLKCLVDLGFKTEEADVIFYRPIIWHFHDIWRYILTCFSKINANTFFKEKQLHFSIRMGQVETVKAIVNEASNEYKLSRFDKKLAVYIAAESGNAKILEVLLNSSYPIDSVFSIGSPLHIAATVEDTKLVKLLLEAGADVNLQTEKGLTPLHFAACAGQPAAVKCLLENGADPSIAWTFSGAPLEMALKLHSPSFSCRPTSPLVFEGLVKVTESLIRYSEPEEIKSLVPKAVGIRVQRINNSNTESNELTTDEDDSEFRPGIVRCLFNYLSDQLVISSSDAALDDPFPIGHTPELLRLLMEYNDCTSCIDMRVRDQENNYKCQLLLTGYSRNIHNLLNTADEIIWHMKEGQYEKADMEGKPDFIKLIVARLVLLTNNCYPPLIAFCLKNNFNDWREKCVKEKRVMQRTKVSKNLNVTFYDVSTKSANDLLMYAGNKDYLKAIKSCHVKFPVYADFLKENVEMSEKRRNFINECSRLLYRVVKKCYKIQISNFYTCHIFQYLTIIDLQRFSAACS
ncbi:ankyrin-3-like isoform X1 [Leptopilina heterotoma]|uniref:ankyrin-3-like isoform X1 n=1 Tax=Leptopilina heterotoma TaxID=63436 RepID=UPI001CA7B8E9|nr:ankyrin-3-like isoform X1 [Leptopilina heterotoma]